MLYYIVSAIGCILFSVLVFNAAGPVIAVPLALFLLLIIWLFYRKRSLLKDASPYLPVFSFFLCLCIGIFFSSYVGNDYDKGFGILGLSLAMILMVPVSLLTVYIFRYYRYLGRDAKDMSQYFISALFIVLYILFMVPAETMLANSEEYSVPIYTVMIAGIRPAILSSAVFILLSLTPGKHLFKILSGAVTAAGVAVYLQNMFMNIYIGSINGSSFDFRNYPIYTCITTTVWILCFAFFIIFGFKTDRKMIFIPVLLFALEAVSVFTLLIKAPKQAFEYNNYHYDYSEQYVVSRGRNIIIMVLDGVDNGFIKSLLEESPEIFDDYNDFTLYTNTCSVYDYTHESLPQMMTGYYIDHQTDNSDIFYSRFRDNNYRINFYNYEAWSTFPDVRKYIDNSIPVTIGDEAAFTVDYEAVLSNSSRLSLYQVLPVLLKGCISTNDISFRDCLNYFEGDETVNYDNDVFAANLKLSLADNDENYFIFHHIDGAHFPCEDYVAETEYCLEIMAEYIYQMKELGVYDDAMIIITADHGIHDNIETEVFPTAATPMFMIKEPGANAASMSVSSAPVYHTDILSTLLINADLYNEAVDRELFGPSIYDFDEDDIRERSWYDTDPNNRFRLRFSYSGDTSDLNEAVASDSYEKLDY